MIHPIRPLFWLIPCLLLFACATEPVSNRYQLPAQPDAQGQGAVSELQNSAFRAMENADYAQAVDYLQRAIRIKPRDPLSWHYLALTYWRSGDAKRCVEMSERSFSYSEPGDQLDYANQRLKEKCLRG